MYLLAGWFGMSMEPLLSRCAGDFARERVLGIPECVWGGGRNGRLHQEGWAEGTVEARPSLSILELRTDWFP